MKLKTKHIIVASLMVVGTLVGYAQPPSGAGPPGGPSGGVNPPCWPPPCVPVDGGISILIALGAAFGGKKAFDHFKSTPEVD